MTGREAFARAFRVALEAACERDGRTQDQVGALIARREISRRRPGPERQAALDKARSQWPRRLSSWKNGDRLPATAEQLFAALDVIAPDTPRETWQVAWDSARKTSVQFRPGPTRAAPHTKLASSHYLRQIEQIAPPVLIGRETELAELSRFCREPNQGPYVWWRAEAWAGKSALLSWFALHPPENVDLISFFVTARQAGKTDRTAFLSDVAEQAAAHLGVHDVTSLNSPSDGFVLDLVKQAAAKAKAEGHRLVLLVDGLDEDTGSLVGGTRHSIAALLPVRPWHDMRVIVAGRPNPPIPEDVPLQHFLRNPLIQRSLTASPAAIATRDAARAELRQFLAGDQIHRRILGFIVAAGGDLTMHDLHELTGHDLFEIDDVLTSSTARTFSTRPSVWKNDEFTSGYIMGHEELQKTASEYLRSDFPSLLARLHFWADDYRRRSWPLNTPEYLLRGYFRRIADAAWAPGSTSEDRSRHIALALDRCRHDRMLDVSGGDVLAFAEISETLDLARAQVPVDYATALRLALHRNELEQRNGETPTWLPALWARLGQPVRGESLARSITNRHRRSQSLAQLEAVLAGSGHPPEAVQADRANVSQSGERWANAGEWLNEDDLDDVDFVDVGYSAPAPVLALVRDQKFDEAEAVVRATAGWSELAPGLMALAEALALAAEDERARNLAEAAARAAQSEAAFSGRDPEPIFVRRVGLLASLAHYEDAEERARQITNLSLQARALTKLVHVLADVGRWGDAERIAVDMIDDDSRAKAVRILVVRMALNGQFQDAQRLVRSVTTPAIQALALVDLLEVLVRKGETRQMQPLTEIVDRAIDAMAAAPSSVAFRRLAMGLARAGKLEQALRMAEIAERATHIGGNVWAHTLTPLWVLLALIKVGDAERARRVAVQAQHAAQSVPDPRARAYVTNILVGALAWSEQYEAAERAAFAISDPSLRVGALARVTEALTTAGEHDRARWLTQAMMEIEGTVTERMSRSEASFALSAALLKTGNIEEAERVAWRVGDPYLRVRALSRLIEALSGAESPEHLRSVVQATRAVAGTMFDSASYVQAQARLAEAVARVGDTDQARLIAGMAKRTVQSVADPVIGTQTMIRLLQVFWNVGDLESAHQLARAVEAAVVDGSSDPQDRFGSLSELLQALTRMGDSEAVRRVAGAAEQVAGHMSAPDGRVMALCKILEALLRIGDMEGAHRVMASAEEAAHSIGEPRSRVHFLIEILGTKLENGLVPPVGDLMDVIGMRGEFLEVLLKLGHANVGALRAVADDLSPIPGSAMP